MKGTYVCYLGLFCLLALTKAGPVVWLGSMLGAVVLSDLGLVRRIISPTRKSQAMRRTISSIAVSLVLIAAGLTLPIAPPVCNISSPDSMREALYWLFINISALFIVPTALYYHFSLRPKRKSNYLTRPVSSPRIRSGGIYKRHAPNAA